MPNVDSNTKLENITHERDSFSAVVSIPIDKVGMMKRCILEKENIPPNYKPRPDDADFAELVELVIRSAECDVDDIYGVSAADLADAVVMVATLILIEWQYDLRGYDFCESGPTGELAGFIAANALIALDLYTRGQPFDRRKIEILCEDYASIIVNDRRFDYLFEERRLD
jgi:hypothetical protein